MVYLQLILGFALLVAGGDALVRGAVSVAARFGVSPLLIGLTLVGFGTSTPELVTSLQAAWNGYPGIAVGNVVGSNIANILLILGVAAIIMPVAVEPVAFRRDGGTLVVATVLAIAVIMFGSLERWMGARCSLLWSRICGSPIEPIARRSRQNAYRTGPGRLGLFGLRLLWRLVGLS